MISALNITLSGLRAAETRLSVAEQILLTQGALVIQLRVRLKPAQMLNPHIRQWRCRRILFKVAA
jgi:hypothetical protein